ncbi:MAG: biopolymer transporter ExbD [Planctomycetota bacterium]
MKLPSALHQKRADVDMNSVMTPMIDIVFLLLIYFVWTVTFISVEKVLASEISAQTGSDPVEQVDPLPEDDFDNIVIRIFWDGVDPTWTVNEVPADSAEEVEQRLSAVFGIQPSATVIVHPDPVVPLGHVIEIYDASKSTGFEKVSFAVNP